MVNGMKEPIFRSWIRALPHFRKLKYQERKEYAGDERRDQTQVGPRLNEGIVDYGLEGYVSTADKTPISEVETMVLEKGGLTHREVNQVDADGITRLVGSEMGMDHGSMETNHLDPQVLNEAKACMESIPSPSDKVGIKVVEAGARSQLSNDNGAGQQSVRPSLQRRWVRKARAHQIRGNEIHQK
ncbi:hypothetical protein QYF36_017232 [Acer negundo]|nr:hypothetical protein QYF36_017232 [Acer negundo]